MSWGLLPPIAVLLLAAALPAALALYVYRSRSARDGILLVLVLLAMSEWAVAYAVELAIAGSAGELFWARVKLIGALALPSLWLALALHHTGRGRWLNRRNLAALAVPPVLMLGLVWTGVVRRFPGSDVPGVPAVGSDLPFWVIALYCYGLVLLGAALLVSNIFDSQRLYRKQSAVLVLAALAPWAANASNLARTAPDLDPTPFVFPLTVLVLAWGIWRYRLLDVVAVDRGYTLESMTDGVMVLDPRNRILDLNPAAERILGTAASQAVGQDISALVSNRAGWLIEGRGAAGLLGGDRERDKEYAEISTWGGEERRHYELVLSRLGEPNDRRSNRLLFLRDITERKRDEGRLDRLAHYDLLTDLPNRRLLHDRLKQAMAQARRRKTVVAILFLDLDRFKHVNDTLGHEIGDLLLVEVADRLTACVREADTVSRLAGDEFVAVLTDVAEAGDVTRVAQRVVEALSEPYELKDHELRTTASVGISLYPADGQNVTDLLEKADAAMYRAKTLGKNRFEFYTEGRSPGVQERPALGGELEVALERGEFAVHYQPIVSMATGKVFGVEALVRWEHPERGLLPPAQFIQAAEETGLMVPIGLWVMRESCIRASRWRDGRGPDSPPLTVCVNLSARQLEHPDLARDTERILAETGLDADGLLLEISEAAVMRDAWSAATILGGLKELGVRLAIDDFGTGYSSLPHLNHLPVDYLKIDRSLVDGLEEDPEKKVAAAAMVSLAHALGMEVVGEGVENSRQFAHLKLIGCDLAQGHYLGEAVPSDEAERAISFIDRYH